MNDTSLDGLISLILAQNRELKKMARQSGQEPTGYSLFDADGRLLKSGYIFPFELMLIAQLLREGELVTFVRADSMPDGFYLVDKPDEDMLIADTGQKLPDLSALAEIARMIMWHKDGVHHVVPRDHGQNPLKTSGIRITARSSALLRRVIADMDPTAILR